jgi:hypothetical protein
VEQYFFNGTHRTTNAGVTSYWMGLQRGFFGSSSWWAEWLGVLMC